MAEVNGAAKSDSGKTLSIVAYVLFLVGWPSLHLSTIAAVVIAYVQRAETRGTIWESHFTNIIHTFWISLLAGIVVVPLCFVLVGIPFLIALIVWFLYRTIKGLVRALDDRAY
ncbi:MAG: hypothetical protein KGM97_00675 [Alphaproteobacteria bacterium]|nr:hypothetical protein [Alphaproteobacteria bacterium]MDE2629476.1 hypothetical protein [Alphaproteobacteria bacterium]